MQPFQKNRTNSHSSEFGIHRQIVKVQTVMGAIENVLCGVENRRFIKIGRYGKKITCNFVSHYCSYAGIR